MIASKLVKNAALSLDVSFDSFSPEGSAVELVFQVATNKDQVLFWAGFPVQSKNFSKHIDVPMQLSTDSTVCIKSFLWNKNKMPYKYAGLKIFLYQKSK